MNEEIRKRKSEKLLRAMGEINDSLVLSCAQEQEPKVRRHRPRWVVAAAAAVLVLGLVIGAGAAGGAIPGLTDLFSPAFYEYPEGAGPELELLEQLGQPVGVRVEEQGVDVTVKSFLRDRYTCVAVLSVHKKGLEGNELSFDWNRLEIGGSRVLEGGSAAVRNMTPGDDALEYVITWQEKEPIPTGKMEITLENLRLNIHRPFREKAIQGAWKLAFEVETQDLSRSLPAGQHPTIEGAETVLEEITLSPLSLAVKYTVGEGVEVSRRELPEFVITLKDGTRLFHLWDHPEEDGSLSTALGISEPNGDGFQCFFTAVFNRLVPLEEIESFTIEGETIPLE